MGEDTTKHALLSTLRITSVPAH